MNYFCHAILSDQSPEGLAGTIGGDGVKGRKNLDQLSEAYNRAVREHRLVDELSRDLKLHDWIRDRLPDQMKRYSGIYSDLLFDHLLFRKWDNLVKPILLDKKVGIVSTENCKNYLGFVESKLTEIEDDIPEVIAEKLKPIRKYDLLIACEKLEGLNEVLYRITQRFKRYPPPISLEKCLYHFMDDLDETDGIVKADLNYLQSGLLEFS